MSVTLPIDPSKADILKAWRHAGCIISSPPGSGKTTRVPLWIAQQSEEKVYLLIPKRFPVILAAKRLAEATGQALGEQVGYQIRGEAKLSNNTQLIVTTYGAFLQRLLHEPDAINGSTVIFDEFHERQLNQDMAFALLDHYREYFDDSVKWIFMSATLQRGQLEAHTGLPLIQADGHIHPVDVHYEPVELHKAPIVSNVVMQYAQKTHGHTLVFLAGIADIRRLENALPSNQPVLILHGQLDKVPDMTQLESWPNRIVLATNIAQSSVTLPRVHLVIDTGLERYAVADSETGFIELKTRNISQADATQRMGRAGRLGPGQCVRLWSEDKNAQRVSHHRPEIFQAQLTELALQACQWGADITELHWLDSPTFGRWQHSLNKLKQYKAIDEQNQLTPHGYQIAKLGLPLWLANAIATSTNADEQNAITWLAAHIIAQKPLGYETQQGHMNYPAEPSVRHEAMLIAKRLNMKLNQHIKPLSNQRLVSSFIERLVFWKADNIGQLWSGTQIKSRQSEAANTWGIVFNARKKGSHYVCEESLPVSEESVLSQCPIEKRITFVPDNTKQAFTQYSAIGGIILTKQKITPNGEQKKQAWFKHIQAQGESAFQWFHEAAQLKHRWHFVQKVDEQFPRWPTHEAWAALTEPYLLKAVSLNQLKINEPLLGLLNYQQQQQLQTLTPTHWKAPSGRKPPIEYDFTHNSATASLKLQECFGLTVQPMVAGKTPLTLAFTAPNQRPVANVTDISYFWANVYPDVRKELRGRYAKHPWPEDPLMATATAKTKRHLP